LKFQWFFFQSSGSKLNIGPSLLQPCMRIHIPFLSFFWFQSYYWAKGAPVLIEISKKKFTSFWFQTWNLAMGASALSVNSHSFFFHSSGSEVDLGPRWLLL
jgi:hypothetical protein